MLHLTVCDTSSEHFLLLNRIISSIQKKQPHLILTSVFFRQPQKLINRLYSDLGSTFVYILEIHLQSPISGLHLAQSIREKQPFANIIFFTTQEDCASTLLNLHIAPIAYLSKYSQPSELEQQLEEIFLICANRHELLFPSNELSHTLFTYKTYRTTASIPCKDILYFEYVGNHKIDCHTISDLKTFNSSLKKISTQLKSFLQVHQAFLINPKYPWKYNTQNKNLRLTLQSKKIQAKIPIGRTFLSRHKTWIHSLPQN